MSVDRRVSRPSGMPPPLKAVLTDGTTLDLVVVARAVADVHLERHPEDVERYGPVLAREWCEHDVQHLVNWAALDIDLPGQVGWLARVLDARGYPLENLADCLRICAEVLARVRPDTAGLAVAGRLSAVAGEVGGASRS